MLWNKGVGIFVEAVRILQRRGINARFVLVGAPDPESPASVSREQLEAWHQSGILEWWGHRTDMPSVLASSNIVCFPSHYGEGVPKILLEAAAAGRVLITTDSPGCHEAVRHEENGLLVPRRDAVALADAIGRLIADPGLRARLGACGRAIVVREFTVESVIADTLMVYRSLLKSAWPAAELEGAACATIVTRP
jgi:glycosyltransferase involved in cell wall biosynthesis